MTDAHKPLLIFGAGAMAEFVFDLCIAAKRAVAGFVVDTPREVVFRSRPVISAADVLQTAPPSNHEMFVAIGYSRRHVVRRDKRLWAQQLGYAQPWLAHKSAWIDPSADLGANVMVHGLAYVGAGARLGAGATLLGGRVMRDAQIGEDAILTHRSVVDAHAVVHARAFLGSLSYVAPMTTIGHSVIMASGAVAAADVAEDFLVSPRPSARQTPRVNV